MDTTYTKTIHILLTAFALTGCSHSQERMSQEKALLGRVDAAEARMARAEKDALDCLTLAAEADTKVRECCHDEAERTDESLDRVFRDRVMK